jgi:O-methyltransferase involved in polyketide biosynthesis
MTLIAERQSHPGIVPALAGIPETMLWTLYARACESARNDAVLRDPEAVRLAASIDFDFAGRFGIPDRIFALRAALIDRALIGWLRRHPDGLVVSLGEGLETQQSRVDNGRMRWLSVDLPEGIRLRQLLIQPTERSRHLACSVLDPAWVAEVGTPQSLFIVAQGLLMYLQPADVRGLLRRLSERFPGADLVFDVVNRAVSVQTSQGARRVDGYVWPPMPWGLDRNEIVPTLRDWGVRPRSVRFLPYRLDRHRHPWIENLLDRVVPARQRRTSLVHLTF